VIGILLGTFGALVLSRLAHWNTLISPGAVLLAFCCAIGTATVAAMRHTPTAATTTVS